jgi:hypothetical protein
MQVVSARRPFQYNNLNLDIDQRFELAGEANDERLLRLNYCKPVAKGTSVVKCGACGADFVTDTGLNIHGKKRHSGFRDPVVRDASQRRLSPEEINRDIKRSMTQMEAASMGLSPQTSGEKDEVTLTSDERRALSDPDREIRFDKTEASKTAGEGAYELQSPVAKKKG